MAKILLVEDEAVIGKIVSEMLIREQHEVVCAKNGQEGLALLKRGKKCEGQYDFLVTDYEMPKMSGDEMLVAAKQSDALVPFLMLTGSLLKVSALCGYGDFFRGLLAKPTDFNLILPTIKRGLAEKINVGVISKYRADLFSDQLARYGYIPHKARDVRGYIDVCGHFFNKNGVEIETVIIDNDEAVRSFSRGINLGKLIIAQNEEQLKEAIRQQKIEQELV